MTPSKPILYPFKYYKPLLNIFKPYPFPRYSGKTMQSPTNPVLVQVYFTAETHPIIFPQSFPTKNPCESAAQNALASQIPGFQLSLFYHYQTMILSSQNVALLMQNIYQFYIVKYLFSFNISQINYKIQYNLTKLAYKLQHFFAQIIYQIQIQRNPATKMNTYKENSEYTDNPQKNENPHLIPINICQIPTNSNKTNQFCHSYGNSQDKKLLYETYKSTQTDDEKVFHPMEWSKDDFQIGRHLGKGKYGHVYLARQKKSKHIIALKVIHKKQIINSQIINQTRRQIQIHSHLDHPNILKMHGFFYDQKRIYYILQYANGGELYHHFKNIGRFSQKQSCHIISQMIDALIYLHSKNIIHRDIKPENILLTDDNTIKLTDFGWSIHNMSKKRDTFCGTPDYLCPQMILKKDYDYMVDNWCLGVLAYELVAGSAPFFSYQRKQLGRKIATVEYQFPQNFSTELKNFVSRLLIKDPSKRMTLKQAANHPWILKYQQNQSIEQKDL